jgi:hypothetical protein
MWSFELQKEQKQGLDGGKPDDGIGRTMKREFAIEI